MEKEFKKFEEFLKKERKDFSAFEIIEAFTDSVNELYGGFPEHLREMMWEICVAASSGMMEKLFPGLPEKGDFK